MLPKSMVNRGVQDSQPAWFQQQIRITNALGLILGVVIGGGFAAISVVVFDANITMILWTLVGFAFMVPIHIMNGLGWYNFTRFVFSGLTTVLTVGYMAQLQQVDDPHLPAVWVLAVSFFATPFMLWHYKHERAKLIATYLVLALIWFSYDWYYPLIEFDVPLNYDVLKPSEGGWMWYASIALGMLNAWLYLFMLKSNYGDSAENV